MNSKFMLLFFVTIFVLPKISFDVFAHSDEPQNNKQEVLSLTPTSFIIINFFILGFCLVLIVIVNKFQKTEKIISIKLMSVIILLTITANAILAMNTYIEVK